MPARSSRNTRSRSNTSSRTTSTRSNTNMRDTAVERTNETARISEPIAA